MKLSEKIKEFIQESTGNYGKAKLVLQKNKFFVESAYPEVLKILLKVGELACLPSNVKIRSSSLIRRHVNVGLSS